MSERAARADASQFERLEALVRSLVDRHRALAAAQKQLRERVAQRDARIRALDAQLVQSNQLRHDAAKRIDELVAQLDRVEAEVVRRLGGRGQAQ
jgi:septal ring factor EnvC (AmiA/AmiB activator)